MVGMGKDDPALDTEGKPFITASGHVVTEGEIEQWVAEAEAGYDIEKLRAAPDRRREGN